MNRGEHIVLDEALGDQDRIFEVVAVPGHEGDQHIAAQCQLTEIGRRAVGDDIALGNDVADLGQRTLVDAGVLVGTLELLQRIDIDAGALIDGLIFVGVDDDAGAVDLIDDAGAPGNDGGARIPSHGFFHTGADQRRLGADQRHRLALHVRAHERTVGVIVL